MSTLAAPQVRRRIRAADGELTGECFTGKAVPDAAFEKLDAAEKKGRLGRLIYQFECMDTLGRNRRIYPTEVWKTAAAGLQAEADRGRVWGRLDHPSYWSEDSMIPTMRDAAVRIVGAKPLDEHNAQVILDVCDNEHGRQLMSLLACGGDLCISQRAIADWAEATDPEKEKYGVPNGEYLVVARSLRLITFDVVSQPGFDAAGEPVVTESNQEGTAMWKSASEVKTAAPTIANELIEEGKRSVDTKKIGDEAVEVAKPEIVKAAVAPLNTKIADLEACNGELRGAFEKLKPALIKAGVVFETVTDQALLGRLETANREKLTFESDAKKEKERADKAEGELKKLRDAAASEAAIKPVRDKYGKGPFADEIVAACKGATSSTEALEMAAAEVGKIKKIMKLAGKDIEDKAFETAANPNSNSDGAERSKEGEQPNNDGVSTGSHKSVAGAIAGAFNR